MPVCLVSCVVVVVVVQVIIVFTLNLMSSSLSSSAAISALNAKGPGALGVKTVNSSLALSRPLAGMIGVMNPMTVLVYGQVSI